MCFWLKGLKVKIVFGGRIDGREKERNYEMKNRENMFSQEKDDNIEIRGTTQKAMCLKEDGSDQKYHIPLIP